MKIRRSAPGGSGARSSPGRRVPRRPSRFFWASPNARSSGFRSLIVDLEEIEGDDALELAEQASFCASDAAERLRRFQTARTRELLRTIDLLAKLRKADAPKPEKKATKEPNPPAAPEAGRSPLVLPLRPDRNPCRRRHDRLPGEAARSGRSAFPEAQNQRERTHFGAADAPRNPSPTRERGECHGTVARFGARRVKLTRAGAWDLDSGERSTNPAERRGVSD